MQIGREKSVFRSIDAGLNRWAQNRNIKLFRSFADQEVRTFYRSNTLSACQAYIYTEGADLFFIKCEIISSPSGSGGVWTCKFSADGIDAVLDKCWSAMDKLLAEA